MHFSEKQKHHFWILVGSQRERVFFPPCEGRESKCHFPLPLWIITFMLWDRFASLIWKTISCLEETFPWMLCINWALKLLTRNSRLSCLKTQSGSWKHWRFLDLQKLAFSMWLLTALFVCYSERAFQNNPVYYPSLFLSRSIACLFSPSFFILFSHPTVFAHMHARVSTHIHTLSPFLFLCFYHSFKWHRPQLRYSKLRDRYVREKNMYSFCHSWWQLKWQQQGQPLPSLFFNAVSTNFARIILSDAWVDLVIFHIVPSSASIEFKRID